MAEFGRRVQAAARIATALPGTLPASAGVIGRLLASVNIWFWAIVGVPTLIAGVYYFAIASDLYLSEAKLVVRGPHTSSAGAASVKSLLGGSDMEGSDTAAVKEFIMSRDAARDLERNNNLRTVLSRPEGDLISRFPGPQFWRHDFEALYDTYKRFVNVEIDETSGIATLQVKAYRPEDAQAVDAALVKYSEDLVNRLNLRAQDDALTTFKAAVEVARHDIEKVQDQLTAYRIKEKMLDPGSASSGTMALVGGMEKELATARGQLSEMLKNAPRGPAIPLLRTRITSIEALISAEKSKLTGDTDSVATKSAEFERLNVQRELDEKALASAFASLEEARLHAQQQQIFIEEIAQPNLPDYALYPKRMTSFLMVVVSCFLAYGIAWLLVAGVREHVAA